MRNDTATGRAPIAARLATGAIASLAIGMTAWPAVSFAAQCTVPGSHDSVQEAVNDPGCDPIDLANATYAESVLIPRSLVLNGVDGGTTAFEGQIRVSETASPVYLNDLAVRSGCADFTLEVESGAVVRSQNVGLEWSAVLPCPPFGQLDLIFADGFEAG